jgi:hypothetical protein
MGAYIKNTYNSIIIEFFCFLVGAWAPNVIYMDPPLINLAATLLPPNPVGGGAPAFKAALPSNPKRGSLVADNLFKASIYHTHLCGFDSLSRALFKAMCLICLSLFPSIRVRVVLIWFHCTFMHHCALRIHALFFCNLVLRFAGLYDHLVLLES